MCEKTIKELAVELIVELTEVCDGIKGRSVFINQLLRSASSIGANVHEARYAQSDADFIHKLEYLLKSAMKQSTGLKYFIKQLALMKLYKRA